MTDFYEQTARGDALGALSTAASFSALWAIGSAWSTAVRAISLQLFPHETMDIVVAEILAAAITTFVGLAIALVSARAWSRCCVRPGVVVTADSQPSATPRSQTIAIR